MLLQVCVGLGFALTLATQDKLVVWPEVAPPRVDAQTDPDESKPTKPPLSFENVASVVATPPRWACELREQFDLARFVDLVSRPSLNGDDSGDGDSSNKPAPQFASFSRHMPACRDTSQQPIAARDCTIRKPPPTDLPQILRTGPPSGESATA